MVIILKNYCAQIFVSLIFESPLPYFQKNNLLTATNNFLFIYISHKLFYLRQTIKSYPLFNGYRNSYLTDIQY